MSLPLLWRGQPYRHSLNTARLEEVGHVAGMIDGRSLPQIALLRPNDYGEYFLSLVSAG